MKLVHGMPFMSSIRLLSCKGSKQLYCTSAAITRYAASLLEAADCHNIEREHSPGQQLQSMRLDRTWHQQTSGNMSHIICGLLCIIE